MKKYVIGIDYGTDSVRALIVNSENGAEIASAVFHYPRYAKGKFCDPAKKQFRQHPADYLEGLQQTIKQALEKAPKGTAEQIAAISVDTTGSTPVAVNRKGTPLALLPELGENPNAMFVLWKDHTAIQEAQEINQLAHSGKFEDYTRYEGGIYSSEWFWAKILHIFRHDQHVRRATFSFVEHCDWIPAVLTGQTDPLKIKRSRCAAGHKALWHPHWGGLPPEEFFLTLDPLLNGLRQNLYFETYTANQKAGTLSPLWAEKLGLSPETAVGTGAFDAHLGAVGGEIQPRMLSKVMGTSTCDMMIAQKSEIGEKLVKGICGQVEGSIVPGMIGLEAGQSAFGDIYAWFKNLLLWGIEKTLAQTQLVGQQTKEKLLREAEQKLIATLSEAAAQIPPSQTSPLALDWLNGRRSPDANQKLKGAIFGLELGTDAPRIFRALVEATAFGTKKIAERFIDEGVPIDGVIALGGVAKKSPFVMQVVADVLNMPIKVARSEQTCALGAAMAASVVAQIHPDFDHARNAMGQGFEKQYDPKPENAKIYQILYQKYSEYGEWIEKNTT